MSSTSIVALLGCAHIHTPGFVKRLTVRDDVVVNAVWDHDAIRAAATASTLNAPVVADAEQLFQDDAIDAIVICTETDRHEEFALAAAQAGKHLFIEKPLGMGSADASRMADAIEAAGVHFQTGFFMRGNPIHQFLRQQIATGAFGRITRIHHSTCHSGSLNRIFDDGWQWMADLDQAGVGGFGDLGAHSLDLMLWLMGDVDCVTAKIGVAVDHYNGVDEYGEGLLRFHNGALGTLTAGWVSIANPITLEISGTEGHAYVLNGELFFRSRHVAGADGETPWQDLPDAWPHAFDLFLDALSGTSDAPLVTVREAARGSVVMTALYAGARRGEWVEV